MKIKHGTMAAKTIIGIIVAVAVVAGILIYTNIYDLAKPSIKTGIDTAKDTISNVTGKQVVQGAEKVSDEIKNVTSQIEIKNPLQP